MTSRRVAIYACVSTDDRGQDPENQLRQLREWCELSGHEIVAEYVEHESGRKGTAERKQFARLFQDASQRQYDMVLVWSLDRFSREGMARTVGYLQRLDRAGVTFHSFTEEMLSTENELVRDILIAVMASLAKQEALRISQRTKAGLERAKASGKRLGRPPVSPAVVAKIEHIYNERPDISERQLAKDAGVGKSTVRKILQKLREKA